MRVMCLLEIYFKKNEEVTYFCDRLYHLTNEIHVQWETNKDWGNRLYVRILTDEMKTAVAKALAHVFITYHLTDYLKKILRHTYYYTNDEELKRMTHLSETMLLDDEILLKNKRLIDWLEDIFLEQINENNALHFHSVIQFRFTHLKYLLEQIVGLAIDDYKREEEHQAFIHTLREYMNRKKTGDKCVHVLQGDPFSFFSSDGERLTSKDLIQIMKQEPLYIVGLDGNEMNLAPLIAIAPNKIYIYGEDPSEPKTMTVINVFQEKVMFLPLSEFPFSI